MSFWNYGENGTPRESGRVDGRGSERGELEARERVAEKHTSANKRQAGEDMAAEAGLATLVIGRFVKPTNFLLWSWDLPQTTQCWWINV